MTTLLSGEPRRRDALDDNVDLARDRELVSQAQAGDRAAFDDLYLRYNRRLQRLCLRRLHDVHEAEDVTQEAFARAWRALPNFGGDRRFYPWLSVIATHLCTDVLRRRQRSTPVAEFHQSDIASIEDGGEELAMAAVDGELVIRAFAQLSDRHQRVLQLREESGWSYQRIADHEGVGITAVETLLWRARQALKREFAMLAGSEGRAGAWLGGLVSMAGLGRLLRVMRRGARHLVGPSARGSVVALGSGAAATAMVVAAVLSPPHATVPTPLPAGASPSSLGQVSLAPGIGGAGAHAGSAPMSGSSATNPDATGASPASSSTPGAALGQVNAAGTAVLGATGQVAAAAGSLVQGVVQSAGQLVTSLPGTVSALGSSLLNAPLLTGVEGAVLGSGTSTGSGASSSTSNPPTSTSSTTSTTNVVGNTLNQISHAANSLLGGR